MDTNNYIIEGYRQLNNDNHYENVSDPIYPRMAIQITGIINKLNLLVQFVNKIQFCLPPK